MDPAFAKHIGYSLSRISDKNFISTGFKFVDSCNVSKIKQMIATDLMADEVLMFYCGWTNNTKAADIVMKYRCEFSCNTICQTLHLAMIKDHDDMCLWCMANAFDRSELNRCSNSVIRYCAEHNKLDLIKKINDAGFLTTRVVCADPSYHDVVLEYLTKCGITILSDTLPL